METADERWAELAQDGEPRLMCRCGHTLPAHEHYRGNKTVALAECSGPECRCGNYQRQYQPGLLERGIEWLPVLGIGLVSWAVLVGIGVVIWKLTT